MKTRLLGALISIFWSSAAFPAAITDVSISRTVSADARAGGNTVEAITRSAMGNFNETRTDTDSGADRSARVTSFQNTNALLDGDYLELTGAAYARSAADGGPVQAIGSAIADLYFTVDRLSFFTMSATFAKSLHNPPHSVAGSSLGIYRITASEEQIIAGLLFNVVDPSPSRSGTLQAGRYHLRTEVDTEISFLELAPMADDITAALFDIRFTVVPESATAALLLVGLTAVSALRTRPSSGGVTTHCSEPELQTQNWSSSPTR